MIAKASPDPLPDLIAAATVLDPSLPLCPREVIATEVHPDGAALVAALESGPVRVTYRHLEPVEGAEISATSAGKVFRAYRTARALKTQMRLR